MTYYRFILIPIAVLLITACSSSLTPPSLTSPSPKPEETITPHPTEKPGKNLDANVIYVKAILEENNTWTFHVTIEHPDTGWDDYVNGWDVVTPDGIVLKAKQSDPFTRLLLHPHETEQPFTRSQSGISVPDGVNLLIVRAHDIVTGYGGKEIIIDLLEETGPGFEIHR